MDAALEAQQALLSRTSTAVFHRPVEALPSLSDSDSDPDSPALAEEYYEHRSNRSASPSADTTFSDPQQRRPSSSSGGRSVESNRMSFSETKRMSVSREHETKRMSVSEIKRLSVSTGQGQRSVESKRMSVSTEQEPKRLSVSMGQGDIRAAGSGL